MDMVDSALERPDVALSKRNTLGLIRVPLRAVRSFLLNSWRTYFRVCLRMFCIIYGVIEETVDIPQMIEGFRRPTVVHTVKNNQFNVTIFTFLPLFD